ncbi:MAG: class I SAM-dependent methyltransferase [Rhodothalassiaceae bacterium]
MTQGERTERFQRGRLVAVDGGPLGRLLTANARKQILKAADERLRRGTIQLRLPDGQDYRCGGHAPGPDAVLLVHRWRMMRRFLFGGALGFSQAYLDGDWDSPAPEKVIEIAALNRGTFQPTLRGGSLSRLVNRVPHLLRPNSKRGSRRNIEYHYDLGNDFYDAWLDPSMTYSSALFNDPAEESLEAAQQRKYRSLMDRLELTPGDTVLEIGCGWGGFAEMAAKERGATVTAITLSREQAAYARERLHKAGLADKVRIELVDYRDVAGRFDKVASIEMFEAVGERYWPAYFATLRRVLKPGGVAGLQIISIDEALFQDYRRGIDFIQAYIFPGGMLPTIRVLGQQAEAAGLKLTDKLLFGLSYAETLKRWRQAFEQAFSAGRLPAGIDERFRRLWRYYLCYCEGGFRAGSIDVGQYSFRPL